MKIKKKSMKGEGYKCLTKINGRWIYGKPKKARQLKPACNCTLSRSESQIKCNLFTEEERHKIFERFWKEFNWKERRTYVDSLIDTESPKDKKNMTSIYHLKLAGIKVRFCKKMFNNTLDLGEWSSHDWAFSKKSIDKLLIKSNVLKTTLKKGERFSHRKLILKQFFYSLS